MLSGGIEGKVRAWDLRKGEVEFELEGHTDVVTGLAVSADGDFLASNAMDSTLRTWDLRQRQCVAFCCNAHRTRAQSSKISSGPQG